MGAAAGAAGRGTSEAERGAALRAIPRAARQANAAVVRGVGSARNPKVRRQVECLGAGEAAGRTETDAATEIAFETTSETAYDRTRRMTFGAAREAARGAAQGTGVTFAVKWRKRLATRCLNHQT